MRTAGNPIKENAFRTPPYKRHRLVMPVYIPNCKGYYEDALRIFEICLDSLTSTICKDTMDVTIIDNGSMSDVRQIVDPYLECGLIDQYLRNNINRGKADAIIGVAKSCYEPFITIADADVLFLPGWISRVEKIYESFPQAGNVCPFPAPNLRHHHTVSTWFNHFSSIHCGAVVAGETLKKLEETLGIADFFVPSEFVSQWYVSHRNGVKAIIGAGHFVATYRRSVFDDLRYRPMCYGLKGGLRELEKELDRQGLSRLSCTENYVLHMGNKLEDWMNVEKNQVNEHGECNLILSSPTTLSKFIPGYMRGILMRAIQIFDLMRKKR